LGLGVAGSKRPLERPGLACAVKSQVLLLKEQTVGGGESEGECVGAGVDRAGEGELGAQLGGDLGAVVQDRRGLPLALDVDLQLLGEQGAEQVKKADKVGLARSVGADKNGEVAEVEVEVSDRAKARDPEMREPLRGG